MIGGGGGGGGGGDEGGGVSSFVIVHVFVSPAEIDPEQPTPIALVYGPVGPSSTL